MDETLLHAATQEDIYTNKVYGDNAEPSFTTTFVDNNLVIKIGVFLRPYLQEMLQRLQPLFDLCVYTASERVYADAIINKIDPSNKFFVKRLYRDKCTKAMLDGGRVVYLKDLRCIQGYQMQDIVIVDNSLLSFALQPENGIPISSYFYDKQDLELKCLC